MSFSSINLTLEKFKIFLFHNVPHIVRGGQAESLGAARSDLHLDTGAAQTQVLRPDLYIRTVVVRNMYNVHTYYLHPPITLTKCVPLTNVRTTDVPSMCIVQSTIVFV